MVNATVDREFGHGREGSQCVSGSTPTSRSGRGCDSQGPHQGPGWTQADGKQRPSLSCPRWVECVGPDGSARRFPRSARTRISTVASRVKCSFCGKSQDDVEKIVAGPDRVYICNECVALCNDIMAPGPARSGPAGE